MRRTTSLKLMRFTPKTQRGKAIGGGLSAAVMTLIGGVIAVEGGYVDHPHDNGGATMYGITERVARDYGYKGVMQDLPRELAEQIYVDEYVNQPKFNLVLDKMPAVGEELVDAGVNVGTKRASCWLQESLNNLNRAEQDYKDIRVDCRIGQRTLDAMDGLVAKRGEQEACELLIKTLDGKQIGHYTKLAERNYKYQSFYVGWVAHRIGNATCEVQE